MKYYRCDELENTGLVKTAMVPKDTAKWRIFSLDPNREDIKNYHELAFDFGVTENEMIRIKQKHSNNIRIVTKEVAGEGVVRIESDDVYDGLITNEKRIMLCTIQSDCTPVFILDPVKKAIGMVHSGWRGTVGTISINAINLMKENYGSEEKDLLIYLGPSICGDCYEVGEELIDEFKFIINDEQIKKVFKEIKNTNFNGDIIFENNSELKKIKKYLLDVSEAIKMTLIDAGVKEENIFRSVYCTYHSNIFSSWRLDRDKTNQMLTAIMLL